MNRQEFLKKTALAGAGLAFLPSFFSCLSAGSTRTIFEPLSINAGNLANVRGNLWRYTNKGGTVGILETTDGFVITDSQFVDSIQPVLDAISTKGKPVLYLCNTHHHGDHTSGNFAFKDPQTKVFAHQRVPELQKLAAEKNNKLSEQRYATVLFEKEHVIDLGRENVKAYHFGNGHTFGDAMYHFEKDNVVHMGDLMFNNIIPVYRTADGADSQNWIKVLEKAVSYFDDDTKFIFGHGNTPDYTVGTKENLREMGNFLIASNEFVLKAIREGKSTEDLLKSHSTIPGFENRNTPERFKGFLDELRKTLS